MTMMPYGVLKISLQIIFEAIAGTSYTGDIAIDDIRFKEGPCNGHHLFINHTDSDPQNDGKK